MHIDDEARRIIEARGELEIPLDWIYKVARLPLPAAIVQQGSPLDWLHPMLRPDSDDLACRQLYRMQRLHIDMRHHLRTQHSINVAEAPVLTCQNADGHFLPDGFEHYDIAKSTTGYYVGDDANALRLESRYFGNVIAGQDGSAGSIVVDLGSGNGKTYATLQKILDVWGVRPNYLVNLDFIPASLTAAKAEICNTTSIPSDRLISVDADMLNWQTLRQDNPQLHAVAGHHDLPRWLCEQPETKVVFLLSSTLQNFVHADRVKLLRQMNSAFGPNTVCYVSYDLTQAERPLRRAYGDPQMMQWFFAAFIHGAWRAGRHDLNLDQLDFRLDISPERDSWGNQFITKRYVTTDKTSGRPVDYRMEPIMRNPRDYMHQLVDEANTWISRVFHAYSGPDQATDYKILELRPSLGQHTERAAGPVI